MRTNQLIVTRFDPDERTIETLFALDLDEHVVIHIVGSEHKKMAHWAIHGEDPDELVIDKVGHGTVRITPVKEGYK